MLFRELKPRHSRTKMASRRRQFTEKWNAFNRFHFYKARIKYGFYSVTHWWKKKSKNNVYF